MYLWKLSSLKIAESLRRKLAERTNWPEQEFVIVTDGSETVLSLSDAIMKGARLELLNDLSDFMDGVVWRDALT